MLAIIDISTHNTQATSGDDDAGITGCGGAAERVLE
jgi:hypothetical protein